MGTASSVDATEKEKTILWAENQLMQKHMVSEMKAERDERIFNSLLKIYATNADKFDRIVHRVNAATLHTAPLFGKTTVSDVKPIEDANQEDFKTKFIDETYIKATSDAGKELLKSTATMRKIQYSRWRWAQSNMGTYINQLRLSGFSDQSIQGMLSGVPLCFESPATYKEFSAACVRLCRRLEQAPSIPVSDIRVTVTGSSVIGFSQNPLKGKRDQPTKMTSASKSDVDICLVGDGMSDWICRLSFKDIPFKIYPCTAGADVSTSRYGIKPSALKDASPEIHKFNEFWSKKLKGGLQITFQDAGSYMPPWEILMPGTNETVELGAKSTSVQVDDLSSVCNLKMMQWNILASIYTYHFKNQQQFLGREDVIKQRYNMAVEEILKHKPDVVTLQEVDQAFREHVSNNCDKFSNMYDWFWACEPKCEKTGKLKYCGRTAVLVKRCDNFTANKSSAIIYPTCGSKSATAVRIEWDKDHFVWVASAHLPTFTTDRPDNARKSADILKKVADGIMSFERDYGTKDLKLHEHVVLAGDFNMKQQGLPILLKHLESQDQKVQQYANSLLTPGGQLLHQLPLVLAKAETTPDSTETPIKQSGDGDQDAAKNVPVVTATGSGYTGETIDYVFVPEAFKDDTAEVERMSFEPGQSYPSCDGKLLGASDHAWLFIKLSNTDTKL